MTPSSSETGFTQEIDAALGALGSARPRDGLEQRVLARIAAAPILPWYQRFALAPTGSHRWMLAAASAVIVAGGVTMGVYRSHPSVPVIAPAVLHAPHPAQQPVAAAAAVGVTSHPLQANPTQTRHRGIHRSYRAAHDRVPLPRGAAVPLRPHVLPGVQ